MLLAYVALAVTLYLLPAVVWVSWLGRRSPAPPFTRVLDVATAIGVDALLVLTLARFMPLAKAAWVSRGAYALFGVYALARTRTFPRPRAGLVVLSLGMTAAVWHLFQRLSYDLIIWDRDWHLPLASLLRAERVPFDNVFLPRDTLRYHFLGDVLAAVVQTLSLGHINSSLALSVVHDLFLALTAGLLASALGASLRAWGLGERSLTPRSGAALVAAGLAALPVTLASPLNLLQVPWGDLYRVMDSGKLCGRTYLPFPSIGYRPHVVVATFFLVAVFLALMARNRPETRHTGEGRTTAALLSAAGALALTDEASMATLLAALGATWLIVPGALHPKRWKGLVILAAFALALPWVSTFFGASLSPGGAAQYTEVVPARHLELFDPPVKYDEDPVAFKDILLVDYFPYYAVSAAMFFLALWKRRRDVVAAFVFYAVLSFVSCALALKLEVNKAPSEGHRFLTAALVLSPAVAAYGLCAVPGAWLVRALCAAALVATGLSGHVWLRAFERHRFDHPGEPREREWAGETNPMTQDCRAWVADATRRAPELVYIGASVRYIYAGCVPVRMAGHPSVWNITVQGATSSAEEAEQFDRVLTEDPPRAVICSSTETVYDYPCSWARNHLRCEPIPGGRLVRCPLPPSEVEGLLRTLR